MSAAKHTPGIKLSVKWTDNACCLTHPELGVVRVVKDSGSAHYLEEIAAVYNSHDDLVAALKLVLRGIQSGHVKAKNVMPEFDENATSVDPVTLESVLSAALAKAQS